MMAPARVRLNWCTLRIKPPKLKKGQKITVDMGGPEGVGAYVITRLVNQADGTTVMHVDELVNLKTPKRKI